MARQPNEPTPLSKWQQRKLKGSAKNVVDHAPKPAQFPPVPLDVDDGWPRVVLVKYLEPSPMFPNDPSKGTWKVAYTLYGNTDPSGAMAIVADSMPMLWQAASGEMLEALHIAGERVKAAEENLARNAVHEEKG